MWEVAMARNVRCGLIQVRCEWSPEKVSLGDIKEKMIAKHEASDRRCGEAKSAGAGPAGALYGPYFCAEQQTRWYELTERVPNGATIARMQKLAKKHQMVLGSADLRSGNDRVYYNTAAVIEYDDGRYLRKYRKHHIPHCHPGFWEKILFSRRATRGIPSSRHATRALVCTSATTATFPKGRASWVTERRLSTIRRPRSPDFPNTCGSLSSPRMLLANAYFVAAINRVGTEQPWKIGEFLAKATSAIRTGKLSRRLVANKDELLVADLNLDEIQQVAIHGSSIAIAGRNRTAKSRARVRRENAAAAD